MTVAEIQDLLLKVETAMLAEGCDNRAIYRVINRLVYGEPDGSGARYTIEEGRTALQCRALAQAQAHEHALDRLQSELRDAGEAYAYCSALAVRDAAMDLVAQLREDLGEKDPDLIIGEVVQPESTMGAKVPAEVIEAIALAGRHWLDIELAIANTPSPFRDRAPERKPSPGCYEASFGWVHSRPSCRCKA